MNELIRVLKPGGVCYIEFPNRLFPVERHTLLPLIVWLPKPLGDWLCQAVSQLPFLPSRLRSSLKAVETISTWYPTLANIYWMLRDLRVRVKNISVVNKRFLWVNEIPIASVIAPTRYVRLILFKA